MEKEIQNSRFKLALLTIILIVTLKIGGFYLKVPENTTDSANNSLVLFVLGYIGAKTAQNTFKNKNDNKNKEINFDNLPKDSE
jgi:uncharacterized membrane protein